MYNKINSFILKILLILIVTLFTSILNVSTLNAKNIIPETEYKKNIALNETLNINLNKLKITLEKKYNSRILFEWNIPGENTQNGAIFKKKFEKFGDKEINLSIYKLIGRNKELITNEKINIFVYKKEIIQIFEKKLEKKIESFIENSKDSGIYIKKIIIEKKKIGKINLKEKVLNKLNKSNYLVVWGGKEFIFDILSKVNYEKPEQNLNLVLMSSFNIDILKKYLQNFTSNKVWINDAILIDESSKYEILKSPENIIFLKKEMGKNNYEYLNLNSKSKINEFLFISKFVNNLSNSGFSTLNIYLILIIPFLLVGVIIFKHLIGLSTTGILIPTITTLLFLKLSFLPTITILLIFLTTNLILSKIVAKYNLHYTPRIALLTLVNIIITILSINIFIANNLISISINDIMFIIFFILISEKLVHVIVSKEFSEYKISLVNTLFFAVLSYIFFSLAFTKTFILAYPEMILLLIPISFIIGKFTGLRATEYFRFKEVIKSIEE